MKKVLALSALLVSASAAHAQAGPWPVHTTDGSCSMRQTFTHPEFGSTTMEVSYDASRQLVTLATTNSIDTTLPGSGSLDWLIVFLDNNGEKFDDAWGSRQLSYTREGQAYRFTTSFSGERNVRQILADLSASRSVGFMDKGKLVVAYDLGGVRNAVSRLSTCAQRAVASN
ncbi:hypothetical protein [Altererythrobacter sp. Root672]|uniref:hypothetical protein n=1 Tax=Altererythrobacter sp. Root672 TaxID=1736584 RepID=UPI0006F33F5F|nr:hypothetical protein [Altererythrobacter sp. Root672]KRA83148.1 hypothetical protein ASD76_03495 [Altererythrobacter sp. Root672]